MKPTISFTASSNDRNFDMTSLIRDFFVNDFTLLSDNNGDRVNAILEAIIGTKNTRIGARPAEADIHAMRATIDRAVAQDRPIPILAPWGSEKPDGSNIDIAEVGALKTLKTLNEAVRSIYYPGLQINIRLEDLTCEHLFDDRKKARTNADYYCDNFEALVSILDLDQFIRIRRESKLTTYEKMMKAIMPIEHLMLEYIKETDEHGLAGYQHLDAYKKLHIMGWRGEIPVKSREFLYNQYFKAYPGISKEDAQITMSKYFSETIARTHLGIRGDDVEWAGDFIKLVFHAPAPGMPVYKSVSIRTVPASVTSRNISPWRGKGYLLIPKEGPAKLQLAPFSDIPDNLHFQEMHITHDAPMGSKIAIVRTDFATEF